MTVHIQKLSSIADKLRELGQPVDNMQLVTKALATIPEKFRIVRSIWAKFSSERENNRQSTTTLTTRRKRS